MGRKHKVKVEQVGPVKHKVILDKPRVPVGGFLSFDDAFTFAKNNVKLKDAENVEQELLNRIQSYREKRVVTTLHQQFK